MEAHITIRRNLRKRKTRYYWGGLILLCLLAGLLGLIFFYLSPDRKAARYIGRAESLPPDDSRRESYLQKAASVYETKLAQKPKDVRGLLELANVYFVLGRYDEAIANYQEALAYDSKGDLGGRGYYQLGASYLRRGDGEDREGALRFLEQAYKLGYQGDDPEIVFGLGKIYKESRRYKEAITQYERGMKSGQSPAEAHYILGWLYYNEGLFTESAVQYKKAAQLNPTFAEAHYWLGKAYDKLNRKEEALSEWKESLKVNPNHQYAKYLKGKLGGRI